MKNLTYLLFLVLGVTACSVESIDSTENLLTADAKFKTQSTVTIAPPPGIEVLCAGETYSFSFSANTNKTTQIQQFDGVDDWVQVYKSNEGVQNIVYFDVVMLPGDNFFRTIIAGEGQKDYPDSFYGADCSSCEDLLVAELICGETNTATFTFTAVEAGSIVIQGGLTNGTTIISASSNLLIQNSTHPSLQNSNANVTRWEGMVEACEEVTVTISFTGGNGIGDWSAKRGEEVLGSTEELACTQE